MITSCPTATLPPWLPQFIMLSDLFKKGAMPVTGGVLDQTQWFIAAHQFFVSDAARIRHAVDPMGSAIQNMVED